MPRVKRLTSDQLGKEADLQLRKNARGMLSKWFLAVDKKIEQGDNRTLEMVGRMFQFDKGPGGVTIFNQHMQVNATPSEAPTRARSFDQIIAKLEDRDNQNRAVAQIEAGDANSDDDDEGEDDDDIVDADIEDLQPAAAQGD